jgi:outer membrane protein
MKIMAKLSIVTCALLLLLAATPASAQGRIATVDLKKLFDNYWKTKQADAALKDRAADLDKEHKGMVADFNKATDDYKAMLASSSDPAISDAERDKKKKESEERLRGLKDQQETIVKFENQARTTLDEQRRRMRDNILGEVRKAVEAKAKTSSYTLVIDVAAETINNTPVVLFNTGENDITDSILSQLNASAPPEALTPSTPAVETNTAPKNTPAPKTTTPPKK